MFVWYCVAATTGLTKWLSGRWLWLVGADCRTDLLAGLLTDSLKVFTQPSVSYCCFCFLIHWCCCCCYVCFLKCNTTFGFGQTQKLIINRNKKICNFLLYPHYVDRRTSALSAVLRVHKVSLTCLVFISSASLAAELLLSALASAF